MKKYGLSSCHEKIATIDDLGSIVLHCKKLPDAALVKEGAIARLIDSQPGYAANSYYIMHNSEWKLLPGDILYDQELVNAYAVYVRKEGKVMDQVDFAVNMSAVNLADWMDVDHITVRYLPGAIPTSPDSGREICATNGELIRRVGVFKLSGFIEHGATNTYAIFGVMPNGSWFRIPTITTDQEPTQTITVEYPLAIGTIDYIQLWMDESGNHLTNYHNLVYEWQAPKFEELSAVDCPSIGRALTQAMISGSEWQRDTLAIGSVSLGVVTKSYTAGTRYSASGNIRVKSEDGMFFGRAYNISTNPNRITATLINEELTYVTSRYKVGNMTVNVKFMLVNPLDAPWDGYAWMADVLAKNLGQSGLLGVENRYVSQATSYPSTMMLRGTYDGPITSGTRYHSIWLEVLNQSSMRCMAILGSANFEGMTAEDALAYECVGTKLQESAHDPEIMTYQQYCEKYGYPTPSYKGGDPVLVFYIG